MILFTITIYSRLISAAIVAVVINIFIFCVYGILETVVGCINAIIYVVTRSDSHYTSY